MFPSLHLLATIIIPYSTSLLLPFPRTSSPIYLPTILRTPVIPLHFLPSALLLIVPSHPCTSPLIPYSTLYPTLPYPSGLSRPYPTILSLLLLFPRISSLIYIPSHPYPTLRSPRILSPRIPSPVPNLTLPYPSGQGIRYLSRLP